MFDKIEKQWLRSFYCVFENNSFKRAADFLSLPTSNVSRHIALLEDNLKVKLFERTTRRMTATDAGEKLYAHTQPLLEKLNEAFIDVSQSATNLSGQLKILMPDTPQLARVIVSFCQEYPSLSLCCDTSLNPKDALLDGFDLLLQYHRGKLPDSHWIAKEVFRWRSVVVASPKLIQECGKVPYLITDLSHVPCISSFTVLGGSPWVFKNKKGELIKQKVQSSFKVNSANIAKEAAIAGLGFSILPRELCINEINSGSLILTELQYEPEDLTLSALYGQHKQVVKKVSVFIESLKNHSIFKDERNISICDTY